MKKSIKIILSIIVAFFIFVFFAYFVFINLDEWKASKKINDINNYAIQIENISVDDNVKIVALGEATHGNKEFQELKLELFKALVQNNNYKAFVFEADFGECLYINDYIRGNSKLSLDEIMNKFSFEIYHTKQMKDLIEWMKSYNDSLSENDKVSFYGFDLQNPEKSVEYIINNLKVGDKMPPHAALAKALKASLKTVHDALTILIDRGVLLARRGRYGTTVTRIPGAEMFLQKPETSIFAPAKDTAFYHYEKTQNYIKRLIAEEYQVGDKLPSIQELATRLDLSPNTIRKAFHNLAEEGYLVFSRGRYGGTFVIDIPEYAQPMEMFMIKEI